MLKIKISIILALLTGGLFFPGAVFGREPVKDVSAKITITPQLTNQSERNAKVQLLTSFLKTHRSPMAEYAPVLVDEAEKNGLDWRLVAAISGVESTFGKAIPEGSFNAYGWNNGKYYFNNWEDGISTVSRTLNLKYKKTWGADDPYEIGRYYAASPTWAQRVTYFMDKIGSYTPKPVELNLSL